MGVNDFLDIIFGPLLELPTLWAIIILSFLVSFIINLVYKYATDQNLMKQLKGEIKELQKEAKDLKDRPEEAMKVQKKMMETNMKYMSKSMKPTLITFIPIIIIFGWMSAIFAFNPITPGQDFTVSTFFSKDATGEIEIIPPEGVEVEVGVGAGAGILVSVEVATEAVGLA